MHHSGKPSGLMLVQNFIYRGQFSRDQEPSITSIMRGRENNRYATPTMQSLMTFLSDRNMEPPSITGKKNTLPQIKTKPGETTNLAPKSEG